MTVTHDPVNHPSHYTSHPSGFECIEVTRQLSFDGGNAVKYVWRRSEKGSTAQDLDKAAFYLQDACDRAAQSLHVPDAAARILKLAAATDPDVHAARFYLAVADMRWAEALNQVRVMRAALPPSL